MALLRSIHRDPPLRSWVTLESRPLAPLVERLDLPTSGETVTLVHVLLTAPVDGRVQTPWAYVAWSWPQAHVVAMVDLRGRLDIRGLDLTEVELSTDEALAEIDEALNAGKPVPPVARPLSDIYERALAIPLGVKGYSSSEGAGAAARGVGRQTGQVRQKPGHAASSPGMVAELMTRTRELLEKCGQPALIKEWQRIRARMNAPQFSVVVAGEFSRGKSTLVNLLLDRELLPVGDLPTTAMLARVSFGPEPGAARLFSDGRRERVELAELSSMKATENGVDPEGLLLVQIDNGWLRSCGIQIVDTPGVGDELGHRAALTTEAIASADATVVAISATMPMSLTERAFIEQHVLSRTVPHVAVVLTRLDQVKASERIQVISHVRAKLAEWAPTAELWTSSGEDVVPRDAGVDSMGADAIRESIARWARSPEHRDLRVGQVACQLGALLGDLRSVLDERRSVLELGATDIEKGRAAARQAVDREQLAWEDLRLELESRQIAAGRWITGQLTRAAPAVAETLSYELQRSPQPAVWWERDLPFVLRRELLSLGRGVEAELQKRIAADAGWLVARVQDQLAWGIRLEHPGAFLDGPITGSPGSQDLEDLPRKRLLTRIALGAATVAAYAMFGPLGMAVSLGAGVLTERMMNAGVEEQKRLLRSEVEKTVAGALEAAGHEIRKRLQGAYERMLRETKVQEAVWHEARQSSVDALGADADPCLLVATVAEQLAEVDSLESDLGTRERNRT